MIAGQRRQLRRHLEEFFKNLETETRWTVFGVDNAKQGELDVLMFGPPGSPYENGTFWVHMEFPKRYPLDPPTVEMKTKIFHPLINKKGKICLSILEDWDKQPFVECLNVLYAALEDPAECLPNAIAEESLCIFVEDRDEFEKIARDYTERFAMSKAKMQFDIEWNKGVTLKFARETKIKDQYKRFRPDLIKRLNKCDYMAFVEFANEMDYFIDDAFLNNLGDTPLDTIVALSGGKGFHKNNYPYGNRYHDQNDRNNNNNRNNRRNNNNQNNNNNPNNNNRGGGGGDGDDEGDDSDDGDKYTGNPNEENRRKRKKKKKRKKKNGDNEDDREEGEEDDGTGNNNNNNNNDNNDNCDEEKVAIGRLPSATPTLSTPKNLSCETLPPVIAPRALRDIMLCRGIHNCSGDCGNTLIRASILFYNSLIKGDLDSRLFSEKAHTAEHQEEMWEALLSVFNDDVSNNINMDIIHEYIESKESGTTHANNTTEKPTLTEEKEEKEEKKKKEVDGEELLVDLMCLVDLMTQTVPEFRTGFDAFETEQWPDNRKGTVFEKVEKLFSKMKDPQRIKRITKWSRVMFEEFRKYYNEYQQRNARNNPNADNNESDEKHNNNSNNNSNNNFYVKKLDQVDFYSFNQFLRAVCLHNYGMRDENNNYSGMRNITVDLETKVYVQARNSYSDLPQWAEWSKSTQATNMLVVQKIIKAVKKQFSLQMMLKMASNLGQGTRADASDFDILRLLILTGKFLIECETTFDLHIKCIHNDFSMSNVIKQDKFKTCKLVQALDTDCNEIYNDKRNLMIKGEDGRTEKLLTKDMIKAIRMYTIEEACTLIKGTHFKGKTCKYRDICTLMLQALKRFRKYDNFDISKLHKLYCGLRDVSFTVGEFQSTIQPLLERAGHAKNMDSKDYVATNALEYCIPWHSITSTTPDIRVARWFAESDQATNSSVVFQVLHKTLANTPDILYGDISWISAHEMEQEVVFGPCLLHPFKPYKNDKNQQLKETTHLIKVRPKPTQHVRSLLQVNWFNKYRLSPSYSNSISIGRAPKSRVRSNNGNNSSSGSGSDSSMHSDWEMVGNDDTKTNISDVNESDEKRELRQWIKKLFIGDSADIENKRQEIFDKFCKSDYNTLELVYENVTNERLKKNVEITQADDRTVIISGVYEYYRTKLDDNQSKVLDVLKRVLNKTKKNNNVKEKMLKQYFVAFRNMCDKCEQESINELTKNDLRDDLGIDESGKVRKDILEGIQTEDMVNAD